MKQNLNRASRVRFRFYWPFHILPTIGTMLLFAIAILATWPAAGSAAEPEGCSGPSKTSSPGKDVRVYIDPETGELLSGPPPGQVEAPDAPAIVPEDPAYETDVRPDGTVVLDLSGRRAEELHAKEVDGTTVICHRPGSVPKAPPED